MPSTDERGARRLAFVAPRALAEALHRTQRDLATAQSQVDALQASVALLREQAVDQRRARRKIALLGEEVRRTRSSRKGAAD